jgi:hypothetical protein
MARTLHNEHQYPVPADVLWEIVTDPEFLAARHKVQGAIDARVTELLRHDTRVAHEVETDEYVHTMKGLDKNRVETVSTRYDWDLPKRRGSWEYHGKRGKRLRIAGRIAVAPADRQSRLLSDFDVEVRAPLIGGMIEKRILADIEASLADVQRLTQEFCARRSD